jgi:short-subunit dehydrogenase
MTNPVVMIIGAGPRLGEAVARRFGRDGYDVALIARDEQRLADLGARLKADGITAGWTSADIGDVEALTAAATRFVDHSGRIDVLLHNVSTWRDASTLELSRADLFADLSVGAASLLTAAQAVVPSMRGPGRGTILATGSGAADRPSAGGVSLAAQKAALRALVQALDADLRPEGIHCATVTVRGPIAEGTTRAPERIAEVFAELAAETAASPEAWRTVVDLP